MWNKVLIVLLLLPIVWVLAALVRPASAPPPAPPTGPAFQPQHVSLDVNLDAVTLLEKAIERLNPERTPWLKTKIRQMMTDPKIAFTAEGCLQRGPAHCARLELDLVTHGSASKLLMVSDGKLLAIVKNFPGRPPVEQVIHLTPEAEPTAAVDLNLYGCGGPIALLQQLRPRLHNLQAQTGKLGEFNVVRIKGDLRSGPPVPAARSASIDLDAKTLWPLQLEWRGDGPEPLVRVEFPDHEINNPLTGRDCERLFSYHPQGNVGVVVTE